MNYKLKRSVVALLMAAMTLFFSSCFTITKLPVTTSSNHSNTPPYSSPPPITAEVTQSPVLLSEDREPFTQILGNGQDSITIMLYLCGSDLESSYGCATADLYEILAADLGPNVNVIIETGGAVQWQNNTISNTTNQRYRVDSAGMFLIEDNMGQKDMTSPDTLGDFIRFCRTNYPANRNILILWDHGGGSVSGYGYDEIFDYYDGDSMTLDELQYALELGGATFEIIGFDACLMSTVETGYVLKDFSDYMIASQKLEPGSGWYYTDWLTTIGQNPSISSYDLAAVLIDDYVENASYESYTMEATLAFVDLMKMDKLYASMLAYFSAANKMVADGNFADVSRARAGSSGSSGSRALETDYDHVDLIALAQNLTNSESEDLIQAVREAIVYFGYGNTSDVNGLTIYFPYTDLSYFDSVVNMYYSIGMDDEYIQFLTSFISVMLGGQTGNSTQNAPTQDSYETDLQEWSTYDWYNDELVDSYEYYYQETVGDYYDLLVTEKNGGYVLSLTDAEWDIIVGIELQAYLDDGYGYIDLGSDNVYEFDEDGDLMITFDNTWVSVDGQTVSFYAEEEVITEDGFWYTYGAAPAYLNGELVDIIIMWDDYDPYGYIAGARYYYQGAISQKGYVPLADGDIIEFICDYYNYDYTYDDWYVFNDPVTVYGYPSISYEDIGYGDCLVYYMLTDIYGNRYWTEQVLFYD